MEQKKIIPATKEPIEGVFYGSLIKKAFDIKTGMFSKQLWYNPRKYINHDEITYELTMDGLKTTEPKRKYYMFNVDTLRVKEKGKPDRFMKLSDYIDGKR